MRVAELEIPNTSHVGVQCEASGEVHDIVVPGFSVYDELNCAVVGPYVDELLSTTILKHMVAIFSIKRVGMAAAPVYVEVLQLLIELFFKVFLAPIVSLAAIA